MRYDAELGLLTDTLKKYGIAVSLADPATPPAPGLFLHVQERELSLREFLPDISPATVYTLLSGQCTYTYFLLPEHQPETVMILGPYLTQQPSREEILEWTEMENADPRRHRQIEKYFSSLPVFPRSSHLHLMLDAFFDRIWGAGNYTAESVTPSGSMEISNAWPSFFPDQESALLSAAIMEERYAHENSLIEAVRKGQSRRVETFLSRVNSQSFEQRSSDPVRNVKNYCIITNTLLRKAAEQGGVHPVYIDSISTDFALRIEGISSPAAGPALIGEMAKGYCRLVREHSTKGYSAPIQKAIILIEGNLSGDVTLSHLASELNVNSSYLSALFRKETGVTLTDYIAQRRISHARHLLEDTRLQVQTIGQLCGFEDVHYFSKIFKRLTGMTPKQYRQSHTGQ